jgi:arginase family enzyme
LLAHRALVTTTAVFYPFDLFGSAGTGAGAELLADAFEEMLADNRRERIPTRAGRYTNQVKVRRRSFETLATYQDWRPCARRLVRRVWRGGDLLLWVTGNHLGVLPVYDELAQQAPDTLVVQFDAHLDIHQFADCTPELSHGNFLRHCAGPLPPIINVGHRDLLLPPDAVAPFFRRTFAAADLAVDPELAVQSVRKAAGEAERVFLDIDCDVFDPAFFPAVTNPLPFGLSPSLLLRFVNAAWSERVIGIALSEFDPGRDRSDQGLATLVWLLEYLVLKQYEHHPPGDAEKTPGD